MKKATIMTWVDQLAGVAGTVFPHRRDLIAEKMDEAAKLEEQARKLREEAYFDSLSLEADAKAHWSIDAVSKAKANS
ncbi:stable inheritance protein KleA [Modicisalibacter sp. 'Wilcox']|jgi:hypothetical protein|uniref:stable inheritance protein KleA n=1 Tax=Modicisalibacter sp. 'Wilcox' TaxID=2679914 RepID=UPI0013D131BD|nr:stable inheritance protein KleA [Modicisalibacter sp. 'Wilcox']